MDSLVPRFEPLMREISSEEADRCAAPRADRGGGGVSGGTGVAGWIVRDSSERTG